MRQASRHERHEVFQKDKLTSKNDQRDVSLFQVLLVFKSAIDNREDIESRVLGRGEELTVFSSRKTCISPASHAPGRFHYAQSFLMHSVVKEPLQRPPGGFSAMLPWFAWSISSTNR